MEIHAGQSIHLDGTIAAGGRITNEGRTSGAGTIEADVTSLGTIQCDFPGGIEFTGELVILDGECDC